MDMDKILSYADKISDAATAAVVKHGPVAWETALAVKTMSGIANILMSGIWLVPLILFFLLYKMSDTIVMAWVNQNPNNRIRWDHGGSFFYLVGIVGSIVSVCLFIYNFFYIWYWVAVFKPELAIAKDAIDLVLKK